MLHPIRKLPVTVVVFLLSATITQAQGVHVDCFDEKTRQPVPCSTGTTPPPPDPGLIAKKKKQMELKANGKAASEQGKWADALKLFREALKYGPDYDISRLLKDAEDHRRQQEEDEAEKMQGVITQLEKDLNAKKNPSGTNLPLMRSAPPQWTSSLPLMRSTSIIANDQNAARLGAAQLRLVDGRIANLQKAIALLGDSNPEWARERKRVLEAMHEDTVGLSREGVNLVSIGLTEWAKRIAQAHLSDMRINALVKAFKEPLRNLPSEEARLNRIMATTHDPGLTKAILEYTTALHRLRDAQYSNDVVNLVGRTREAAETLEFEFEVLKSKPQPADVADRLYESSAFVGTVAITFVAEGSEGVAAVAGSALSSIGVGGRELVNLWQERTQLAALDQNSSDRNQMRVNLSGRLNELQQQHDRLVWAVQHAGQAN